MTLTVLTYLGYLAIAVPLTIWVATTLRRNGQVFLTDVFAGHEQLAVAVNRLLVVGFYLVNLGFVALFLRVDREVQTVQRMIEELSVKIGVAMLVLGAMHLINVSVFTAMRRRTQREKLGVKKSTDPRTTWTPPVPAVPPATR